MQDKFDDMSNNLVGKIDEMGYFYLCKEAKLMIQKKA